MKLMFKLPTNHAYVVNPPRKKPVEGTYHGCRTLTYQDANVYYNTNTAAASFTNDDGDGYDTFFIEVTDGVYAKAAYLKREQMAECATEGTVENTQAWVARMAKIAGDLDNNNTEAEKEWQARKQARIESAAKDEAARLRAKMDAMKRLHDESKTALLEKGVVRPEGILLLCKTYGVEVPWQLKGTIKRCNVRIDTDGDFIVCGNIGGNTIKKLDDIVKKLQARVTEAK